MERTGNAVSARAHNHRVRGLVGGAVARDDDRLRARGLLAHAHLREVAVGAAAETGAEDFAGEGVHDDGDLELAAVRDAVLMALSGMEWQKLVVPSMGSTTQSQSGPSSRMARSAAEEASMPGGTDSSPRKPWEGKEERTVDWMTRCTSGSTSVRRSRAFALVLTTSAPSFSSMMVAPSFAASVATRRHAWRIAGRSVWSLGMGAPAPMGSGFVPNARGRLEDDERRGHLEARRAATPGRAGTVTNASEEAVDMRTFGAARETDASRPVTFYSSQTVN